MDSILAIPAMIVMFGATPPQVEYHPIAPSPPPASITIQAETTAENDQKICDLDLRAASNLVAYADYNQGQMKFHGK